MTPREAAEELERIRTRLQIVSFQLSADGMEALRLARSERSNAARCASLAITHAETAWLWLGQAIESLRT